MEIREHEPLKDKTTLMVGGTARYFIRTENIQEAYRFAKQKNLPIFILGGGSNIVLPDRELPMVVIQPVIEGIKITNQTETIITLHVGAGENLDSFIQYTVQEGWWGLENLSWVPGMVGGLAIQNVGAYGVEAAAYIDAVEVFDMQEETYKTLSKEECNFGYRSSIFNTSQKGRYVVCAITLTLLKTPNPILTYRGLQNLKGNVPQQDIRDKVIAIRNAKDLNPARIASAGSFFKNIEVEDISSYNLPTEVQEKLFKTEKGYKIPSAALIQACGLKGLCVGDACISETQGNMIINKKDAAAKDINHLYKKVVDVVKTKTGIELVNEPEFI